MPRHGERVAYRPLPPDFAEQFIRLGWGGIGAAFRAHRRVIKRWLVESGEQQLQQRRRDYLITVYAFSGKNVPGAIPGRKPEDRIVSNTTFMS